MALIRVKRELKKCMEDALNFTINIDDNMLHWSVDFSPNTDIFTKTYNIIIDIPEEYPFKAPVVNFKDYIFHPSIDRKGKMCLGVLADWKPKYTLLTVLNTIQSEFTEPTLDNPINIEAAKLWGSSDYKKRLK